MTFSTNVWYPIIIFAHAYVIWLWHPMATMMFVGNQSQYVCVHMLTVVGWFVIGAAGLAWKFPFQGVCPTDWGGVLGVWIWCMHWNNLWIFKLPSPHCCIGVYLLGSAGT